MMGNRENKIPRVLVVDDDKDITALLKYNLEKEGIKVKSITNPKKAIPSLGTFNPDLIILDIMMPGVDGIGLCRQIRSIDAFKETPVFFLTARGEKYYEDAALEVGGNDYIQKFLGLRSLVNKVHSVLKENYIINKRQKRLKAGGLLIDLEHQHVKVGNRSIQLADKEFELLYFLAQNQGKEISEIHLLRNIWGSESYRASDNVSVAIENIRKKIGRQLISKVQGNTYKFDPRLS